MALLIPARKRIARPAAVWLTALGLVAFCGRAQAQSGAIGEYQAKAAYLYNFIKFVEWPTGALHGPEEAIRVCVLGADSFGRELDGMMEGRKINGRGVAVLHMRTAKAVRDCHVVFISASEQDRARDLLGNSAGPPTLTVGESQTFCKLGGMISFVMEEDKLRFEVNQLSAEQAHLHISSKLLSLARSVYVAEKKGL